ncbi:MAG: aa3-type cytochrome oxidase subunit II [Sciscionella sp.]
MHGSRAARTAKIGGLLALVAIAASGCSGQQIIRFGWPKGVTPEAHQMRLLWTWSGIAALIIGVIVWGLIAWTVIFHRKKGDGLPRQFQYNHSLEIVYTVLPLVIVVVLFYFTTVVQNNVLRHVKPDVPVNVVAFQWNWEFDYPNTQIKDPSGKPVPGPDGKPQIVRTIGTSQEIPLLVLPINKTIGYTLRSNDVIHSFFVPDFHFKRDVFPYPNKNDQDDYFVNSIDQPGEFVGRCAELCGTYHSMMNFEVRALPDKIFNRYISLREQINPQTNLPYNAQEALSKINCGPKLCAPHAITTAPFDTSRTSRHASTSSTGRDVNQGE